MRIKDESWTIVLVGNWNKYILSPEWAAKNIFGETKLDIEFALNLGLPPRYTSEQSHIRMIPAEDRVVFVALKSDDKSVRPDDECLQKMENFARTVVDTLGYTPISAFGINFSFIEDTKKIDLTEFFDLSDNKALSDFGCQFTGNEIKRRVIVDNRTLWFTISQKGEEAFFDFNFHYDVTDATEAKAKIENTIIENKNIAERLLKDVYKLDYDSRVENIA